jgi:hypothetical protein
MKKTDLNIFYQMGQSLGYLIGEGSYGTGKDIASLALHLYFPRDWAISFVRETENFDRYLKDSRNAAMELIRVINAIHTPSRFASGDPVTYEECIALSRAKEEFEKCFERESKYLNVFTVTPKGTRDTAILIESPEDDFTKEQLAVLPKKFLEDLKQAARCLVFEIPTACAFHICRGTEAMILAYYENLTGIPWPHPKTRHWNAYIENLVKEGAPQKITARLTEIKDMDRNAYAHPDQVVTLDEAPVLYSLCAAVNFYMAEEMVP